MKKIFVNYDKVNVDCSCGNSFYIYSTLKKDKLKINVCNKCNSFYTGKQKIVDIEGRVDNFYKRFSNFSSK